MVQVLRGSVEKLTEFASSVPYPTPPTLIWKSLCKPRRPPSATFRKNRGWIGIGGYILPWLVTNDTGWRMQIDRNDIGIVIVTYNSGEEIGPCLDAASASGAEIVVVDNASSDQTATEVECRNVRMIRNPDNRGFAAAVNQGF